MQRKFDGEAIGIELPQAVELLGVRTRQSLSTSVTNQVVRKIPWRIKKAKFLRP
jgi:hypothetical protein